MRVIDLTHTISTDMSLFPGSEKPGLETICSYDDAGYKVTKITMGSHIGTHMDSPAHIYPNRKSLDDFGVEQFIGKALVINCRHLTLGSEITLKELEPYGDKVEKADFLLFDLGWDKRWKTEDYLADFPVLSLEVLDYIAKSGKKGAGVDTLSIDPLNNTGLDHHHHVFKDTDLVFLENLANLGECGDELFWLFALPLKYENSDGAQTRVVAFWDK